MKLQQITLTRTELDRVPDDERILLILLSHVANELNVFAKLVYWSGSTPNESLVENKGNNTIFLTLIRLFTGKLHETWRLFEQAFFSSKLAQTYENQMEKSDKDSFDELKRYFGRKNLIATVRNSYAFHYSPDRIKAAYASLSPDDDLVMYLGELDFNTLYDFSDIIVNSAMLNEICADDSKAAMEKMRNETVKVHGLFNRVIAGLMVVTVRRNLGQNLSDFDTEEVEIFPKLNSNEVTIPFFVNLVEDEDTQQ